MNGAPRSPDTRIGPYAVVRHLASGGMGEVYVARDTRSGDEVALKLLREATATERFDREVRIASRLRHPRVVRVHEHGVSPDGTRWLAMELLRGEDLERRLARGISPTEAVTLAMQVCEALEYAHAHRVVHRDLKPSNVLLREGSDIDVVVLDLGIARVMGERALTATGTILGTLAYMSPEQARGEHDIDPRTDLWSLGVILYESLARALPFRAPTPHGMLYQVLFETPRDLAASCPGAPPGLVELVRRALAKPREERFATAAEFRAALAAVKPELSPAQTGAGRDATGAEPTVLHPREPAPADDASLEHRLTSVVLLRDARDRVLVQRLAEELGGRVGALPGRDLFVAFGVDRWRGDEALRATRLAVASALTAQAVAVATGRVLRGATTLPHTVVEATLALADGEGVRLDAVTASLVRGSVVLRALPDGSARVLTAHADHDIAYDTPFVGRALERALLTRSLDAVAQEGRPVGAVIVGPVGMGLSRLAHEATTIARARGDIGAVLLARCDAALRDAPFSGLAAALADVVGDDVGRLFHASTHGAVDPVAALDQARGAFETVLRAVAARGCVVLAFDDAQWLDPSSRATLRWAFDAIDDLPLAVWTFSTPDARNVLAAALPGATVHELGALSRDEAEALVRGVAGACPDALLDRAGHHPLFLEELARSYAQRGDDALAPGTLPVSIEAVYLAQIDRLDPASRDFLKRAAVFGRIAWVEAVVALGGSAEAAATLRVQGLTAPRPRPRFAATREFVFRSGLLQEVACGLWAEATRRSLHGRAAEWLAARPEATPDELARHWELAADPRAAASYVAAAEASSQAGDVATTCAHCDRALALTDEVRLRWRALVARDAALQLAADRALQGRGLDALQQLAHALGPHERAEAAWRRCYLARISGDRDGATRAGEATLQLATEASALRWIAAAHNELGLLDADTGAFASARAHAAAAKEAARAADDPWLLARAATTEAYAMLEEGRDVADAVARYDEAAAACVRAGDRRREAIALVNGGFGLLRLGDVDAALARFEAAITLSRRVGNARSVAVATQNRATLRRMRDDLSGAEADLAFAGREADALGHRPLRAAVAVERAYLAVTRRDASPDALRSLADEALARAAEASSWTLSVSARAVSLRARALAGDDVTEALAAARALLAREPMPTESALELRVAIAALTDAAEDVDAARSLVAQVSGAAPDADSCRAALLARFVARGL